jgi:hypothetical protein
MVKTNNVVTKMLLLLLLLSPSPAAARLGRLSVLALLLGLVVVTNNNAAAVASAAVVDTSAFVGGGVVVERNNIINCCSCPALIHFPLKSASSSSNTRTNRIMAVFPRSRRWSRSTPQQQPQQIRRGCSLRLTEPQQGSYSSSIPPPPAGGATAPAAPLSPKDATETPSVVDLDDLMVMDVVIFSVLDSNDSSSATIATPHQQQQRRRRISRIGTVQDDRRIVPLSVWSLEPVFDEMLEFLVHEDDMFPGWGIRSEPPSGDEQDDGGIVVHSIVPEIAVSYGSRQVGGGKGPGNPHGEESERVYYVDRSVLLPLMAQQQQQQSLQNQGDDDDDQTPLPPLEIVVRPELEILW